MNEITITTSTQIMQPDAVDWLERGKGLAQKRQEVDWALADWLVEGKQAGFLEQTKFDFISENLGLSPKHLKDAQKAALTFAPSQRVPKLSVEYHAIAASIPKEDALPLLKKACAEKLKPHAVREAVTQYKYNHGQAFDDDDLDAIQLTHIVRAWNRANPAARENFAELIENLDDYGIIDEDVAL